MPKISVLLPAYNAEKYIGSAIQSIIGQTYSDFEFIIINDGSQDRTSEIIKSFNDPRIVFVDNEKHSGLVAVLNQGLDMARGEYIARMDADDIAYPNRFEKQVAFMDANPNVGLSGTHMHIFRFDANEYYCGIREGKLHIHDFLISNLLAHPTVMMRKSVFDKYNLRYDPDYVAAEDYELWTRAVLCTDIAILPEPLLRYRIHSESVTQTERPLQMANINRIQEKLRKYLQ